MTDEVTITNKRFDATGTPLAMARLGADTFGYTADLSIDRNLAQLLRLRVSQINNCTYCLNLHYEATRGLEIDRVADTNVAGQFQTAHDALAEHFTPEQINDIAGIVINMNIWTRLKLAEGATPSSGA